MLNISNYYIRLKILINLAGTLIEFFPSKFNSSTNLAHSCFDMKFASTHSQIQPRYQVSSDTNIFHKLLTTQKSVLYCNISDIDDMICPLMDFEGVCPLLQIFIYC